MFADLKGRIDELTRPRRAPRTNGVGRSLVLIAQPELKDMRAWYAQAFPTLDPDVAALAPWVVYEGDEAKLAEEIDRAVAAALDADRLFNLTRRGSTIVDSLFQAIVVSDITAADGWERAKRSVESIEAALAGRLGETGMLAYIGVFILRRPGQSPAQAPKAETRTGKKKPEPTIAATLKELAADRTGGKFNRVFLLDTVNLRNTILGAGSDLEVLAGQLIYYLQTGPISGEAGAGYGEWLQRAPFVDDVVSGCSAFSLLWPVDQLLALAAVTRGAEVLRRSLLADPEGKRENHYLNAFMQTGRMATRAEARLALTEDPTLPIPDPVVLVPSMDEVGPVDYLSLLEQLIAALPELERDYRLRMEQLAARLNRARMEALAENLDRAVMQERGGMTVARKFLEGLARHLVDLQNQAPVLRASENPQPILREAQALAARMPQSEALTVRAALFASALLIGVASFPLGFLMETLALLGLPALGLGLVGFRAHAMRIDLENRIIELERRIREQWRRAMDAIAEKAISRQIVELQDEVAAAQKAVAASTARAAEVAAWCDTEYEPEFADESTLWKYVVRDRAELLSWRGTVTVSVNAGAEEYWGKDHPVPLWRRLSPPGRGDKPSAWELQVIEKAALYALPACAELAGLGIDDFLRRREQQRSNYSRLLEQTGHPFLRLKPEAGNPAILACFEASAGRELTVVRGLESDLANSFTVEGRAALSHYRLTLFGFLDGIGIDQILL